MKKLAYIGVAAMQKQIVTAHVSSWDGATVAQRDVAVRRELLLQPLLAMRQRGIHVNVAIRNLLATVESGAASALLTLGHEVGKGKFPSRTTLNEWLSAYEKEGRAGLLPKHTGRVRKDYGWEAAAIAAYNRPGKPSMAAVAREMREIGGFETATDKAVRTYLQSLPAQLGENSPARLGKHLYDNSQKHYILRSTENLPVGAIYQGDGHTIDVYLAHPRTAGLWRAELTVWMDIRSRYIVGWHLSNSESAISTIYALSHTLVSHDHVPMFLYIDNGSGYKSKMMTDDCTGYYGRMGIDVIFALPGNAKAKGNIERWFRTMERDFNQRFGDAYCGENMAERVSAKFCADYNAELNLYRKGKIPAMTKKIPTRDEWCGLFAEWLEHYHNRPHPEDKNTTPARLWMQLQKSPVHLSGAELLRPSVMRTVVRGAVRLDNRLYRHPDLIAYNDKDVSVEYDLHNDSMVSVRDSYGRLLCDAALASKRDYLPSSRIEEALQNREKNQLARLDRKRDETLRRSSIDIEGVAYSSTLEHFTEALEDHSSTHKKSSINFDIHDDSYLDD